MINRCKIRFLYLVGGFNSCKKYESQLGSLFPIYGKNVPNHQPVSYVTNNFEYFQRYVQNGNYRKIKSRKDHDSKWYVSYVTHIFSYVIHTKNSMFFGNSEAWKANNAPNRFSLLFGAKLLQHLFDLVRSTTFGVGPQMADSWWVSEKIHKNSCPNQFCKKNIKTTDKNDHKKTNSSPTLQWVVATQHLSLQKGNSQGLLVGVVVSIWFLYSLSPMQNIRPG